MFDMTCFCIHLAGKLPGCRLLLAGFGVSLLFLGACQQKEIKEEIIIEKTIDPDMEPGMMHTVYFWLKEGLSEEEKQDFVRGVRSLEAISSVKRFFIGPPAATPSRGVVDNSFDLALIVWFDDVAGHDAYQVDPIHLNFVEEHEAKFGTVKVYDNALGNKTKAE